MVVLKTLIFFILLISFGYGGGDSKQSTGHTGQDQENSSELYTTGKDGVYKQGSLLKLYGINWFGFENCDCNFRGGALAGKPLDPNRGYRKEDWHGDLTRLAELSLDFPSVFGIDLFNEPHKLTWEE